MDFKNENRHMVDVLFVITLFFVFALSALTLVILGANVYKRTVDHMDTSFNSRTSYAYVTQKLRQNDEAGTITVSTLDDTDAVVMTETVNDTIYNTYLYEYDGYLCELLARADMDMSPNDGTKIIALDSFSIEKLNDSLYSFEICPAGGDEFQIMVNLHSYAGGKDNE